LACHILDEIQRLNRPAYESLSYIMVEKSEFHRKLQRERLTPHRDRVMWVQLPPQGVRGKRVGLNVQDVQDVKRRLDGRYGRAELNGEDEFSANFTVVLANELLDAFPVYLVRHERDGLKEIRVGWDKSAEQFVERVAPLREPTVLHWLNDEQVDLQVGQTAEVNLEAGVWIRERVNQVRNGMIVTIDYGDRSSELYAEHRMNGTLLCYKDHRAYADPYAFPGEQDMTAHVNFDACIRAGEQAGVSRWTYATQKQFLVDAGILDRLTDTVIRDPFSEAARNNRMIRQLLLSDGMSELFKVLVQYKTTDV
jgi:SAM-dependent MidA family methyltransferase